MKNTFSKNKACFSFLFIVFSAYVLCYFLSQTVFHGIYLFEWTANHYYLCLWAAPVTFCFLEKYKAALITAIGNWAGILIGQSLGDFIKCRENHTGHVCRESVAAQDTLWRFDLACRFSAFVYCRDQNRKEDSGWNKKRQEPPHEQIKQNAGCSSKAAVTPGISFLFVIPPALRPRQALHCGHTPGRGTAPYRSRRLSGLCRWWHHIFL